MSGVNKVIIVGRLTRDVEMKDANGTAIANMGIATSEQWRGEDGEKKEKVEFHSVVAFRKLAETCGKYLSKGRQVYIEGKLQTRSWEDDSGQKKYRTDIVADTVQFLGDGKGHSSDDQQDTSQIPF